MPENRRTEQEKTTCGSGILLPSQLKAITKLCKMQEPQVKLCSMIVRTWKYMLAIIDKVHLM